MIDIHTHILPVVDDGSQSYDTSVEMLKVMEDCGVTDVIITPHYREIFQNTKQNLVDEFEKFKYKTKELGIGVNLYLGQEIYYSNRAKSLLSENKLLTLNNSEYVLIELNNFYETDVSDVLFELKLLGLKVIFAHIERVRYLTIEKLEKLKNAGAFFQVNAEAVLGKNGLKIKKQIKRLFNKNLVDFVSSDYHENRKYYFHKAREYVEKKHGKQVAEKVFVSNAQKILKG